MEGTPFEGGTGWKVEYASIGKHWNGIDKIWQESDNRIRDKQLAQLLSASIFMTGVQVSQANVTPYNTIKTKKLLNKLSRGGYLLAHKLNGSKVIPFYSVGPAAYKEDLKNDYIYEFYKKYGTTEVLKILSVNQLFIRFMKYYYIKEEFPVLPPYTSVVHLIPKKYGNPMENQNKMFSIPIMSIRNYEYDINNMKRQLSRTEEDKALIICANEKIMTDIHSTIKDNNKIRITTDDRLFKTPLSSAFLIANKTGYEEVDIKLFD